MIRHFYKHKWLWVFIFLFYSGKMSADGIFTPMAYNSASLSMKLFAGFEKKLTPTNTFHVWSGIGVLSAFGHINYPAYGAEFGIEMRQYLRRYTFEKLSVGCFTSLSYNNAALQTDFMVYEYRKLTGITPGAKLSYTITSASWLVAEPYISAGFPLFWVSNEPESFQSAGLIVNIGIKFGWVYVGKKNLNINGQE